MSENQEVVARSDHVGFSNFRYIWPAECDLMAQLAGLALEQRVADWDGSQFTAESECHVSVWRKPWSPRALADQEFHD